MWYCKVEGEKVGYDSMATTRQVIQPEVWDRVKEAVEGGMPVPRVAERYGIKADTIRVRSKRERWQTPSRVRWGAQMVAPPEDCQGLPITGTNGKSTAENDPFCDKLILSKLEKLRKAAGSDPKVFQSLMAEIAEDKLAVAMAELEPRSVSEVKALNDLVRRNHGFDQAGAAQAQFIRPLRTLTRQPTITLEAEPSDPLDDFPI